VAVVVVDEDLSSDARGAVKWKSGRGQGHRVPPPPPLEAASATGVYLHSVSGRRAKGSDNGTHMAAAAWEGGVDVLVFPRAASENCWGGWEVSFPKCRNVKCFRKGEKDNWGKEEKWHPASYSLEAKSWLLSMDVSEHFPSVRHRRPKRPFEPDMSASITRTTNKRSSCENSPLTPDSVKTRKTSVAREAITPPPDKDVSNPPTRSVNRAEFKAIQGFPLIEKQCNAPIWRVRLPACFVGVQSAQFTSRPTAVNFFEQITKVQKLIDDSVLASGSEPAAAVAASPTLEALEVLAFDAHLENFFIDNVSDVGQGDFTEEGDETVNESDDCSQSAQCSSASTTGISGVVDAPDALDAPDETTASVTEGVTSAPNSVDDALLCKETLKEIDTLSNFKVSKLLNTTHSQRFPKSRAESTMAVTLGKASGLQMSKFNISIQHMFKRGPSARMIRCRENSAAAANNSIVYQRDFGCPTPPTPETLSVPLSADEEEVEGWFT
jgi:hypothetical protein